jgi:hypothetical protein
VHISGTKALSDGSRFLRRRLVIIIGVRMTSVSLQLLKLILAWHMMLTTLSFVPAIRTNLRRACVPFQTKITGVTPPLQQQLGALSCQNRASSSFSSFDSFIEDRVTVVGYGSLLSEKSARLTVPSLTNFRLGRVSNFRRVFSHPSSGFFKHGIANMETLEIAAFSAENCEGSPGFVVSVFEIPIQKMDDVMPNGIPRKLYEREASYDIVEVPFEDTASKEGASHALMCIRSTDEIFIEKWGQDRFDKLFRHYGIETIWGWSKDSGIRPCPVYLRHCYLAAQSMGDICLNSFLDESYLVDRTTTIRQYLDQYPAVLLVQPPPELAIRYNG